MVSEPAIAIRLRGVNKSYGSNHAVRNLDLDVPTGSVCGFLGPNGAGKSTTIRMIMSIIYPDNGTVEVLGNTALSNKDRIGYLPEERGVYRKMKVAEFVEYIAKLKGFNPPDLAKRVRDWLERMQLPGVAKKKCQELSKGMQQKVQFLAAIIHEPELIILDEPFSGLDPVNAVLLDDLINELHADGRTIIFSTHTLHHAERICDRIFLINKGEKLLDDTLEAVRERFDPRTIVAEPLNGELDTNGIPGVLAVNRMKDRPGMEVMFEDGVDAQDIMRAIASRQPMRAIELRRPTLEDIFVETVLKDAGAEAALRAKEELSHV